jgi:hypothetical protein
MYNNSSNDNIFTSIKNIFNNKPWYFLFLISAIIGSSYWTLLCCILPAVKITYESEGIVGFFNWNGLMILLFFIIPFILSVFAAFKMISHLLSGKPYPGGENPYGVIPILSLGFYLVVTCYIFYMYYTFLSI